MNNLTELPEWVKSLGLPQAAIDAIDRYWKPVWDQIRPQLELLPDHDRTAPGGLVAPAGDWIEFEAIAERQPGDSWQTAFERMWPAYRRWYLKDGEAARPDLETCRRKLAAHMPELVPTYERLLELAAGDELAGRFLSMYCPPAFVVGCSQGAWAREPGPALVRNYDYPASKAEGIVYLTAWTGRRIIGVSDCLWGLVDGVNDAGLAASLTFGGRRAVGNGFGIPLVVRYLLETCETVADARGVLARVPVHAAQNVTLLDRSGEYLTAYLGPDREPDFRPLPAATNHQAADDWPEYARAVRTFERERVILELLASADMTRERFIDAFVERPLYSTAFASGFGTLYTAAYFPAEGRAEYRWPGRAWTQSFDHFTERRHTQTYGEERRAA
ncbi:MAG: hypothetical protein JO321_01745 [Solirubrobacterales bacterium]|nr:hypothetical protein [Solirubrobacterales bacterium]